MSKRATIKDIANALNISTTTVNRAFSGKDRISEETRSKVFEKAQELGYEPNLIAKALSSKEVLNIAVICPRDIYFVDVLDGMNAYLQEISDYNVKITHMCSELLDVYNQLECIERCESEGVNALLIAASHPVLLNKAIDKLVSKGIEVMTFSNDAPTSGRSLFIGSNGRITGSLAAELMCKILKRDAQVAMIKSLSPGEDLKFRCDSFTDYITKQSDEIKLIASSEYLDAKGSSYYCALDLLQNTKVDGIYANNMEGTLGLGRAVRELGRDDIVVIGHDLNEDIATYIEEGVIDAIIYQNPFMQGYISVKQMFEKLYLHQQTSTSEIYIQSSVVFKSNIIERAPWKNTYYYANRHFRK